MEKATDVVLRFGGNNEEIRMELAFDAMIDKPIDEIAAHMRTLYHGGSGFELEGRRFSAWYADNGIYIAGGDRARYANTARIVSWKDAAKRVGERINAWTIWNRAGKCGSRRLCQAAGSKPAY